PNPIGQIDDSRAQLSTRSMLVVMKLSSNRWSMSPIVVRVFPDVRRPFLRRFVEREDGLDGARGHAGAAVDALVRMNIKHLGRLKRGLVLSRVDAVHRTDVHARGILGPDARLANDIRHRSTNDSLRGPRLRSGADEALHAGAPAAGRVRRM